jgi:signal transduction histidine kinase
MKLFTKYSRISIVATIAVFLVASSAFFFTLRYVLINQIDEDLRIEEDEISSFAKIHNSLPENISEKDQVINYTLVNTAFTGRAYTSIFVTDPQEKNKEHFRELQFGLVALGKNYRVSVAKSLEKTDDVVESVILITSTAILALLVVSFIINRVALRRLWQPFYNTLSGVKEFQVSRHQALHFSPSDIDEFDFMNQTLEKITQRARVDYLSLKTFSENASHELQTPLAVIRSKLDLLIQDEHLTEPQSQALQSAYNAIQKLNTLNQSLLLLARIENKQFEKTGVISLKQKMEEKLAEFQELWQSRGITTNVCTSNVEVKMNPDLADILLNNLLSNATRHNYEGGNISIELDEDALKVSNSSHQPALDPEKVFDRFYKPTGNNEHNGLGLSIIRQIVNASNFSTEYGYEDGRHSFLVKFGGFKV